MRRLLISALVIAALIGLAPWVLYGIGLNNIAGRPTPPTVSAASAGDRGVRSLMSQAPSEVLVRPMSPWGYIMAIARGDPRALGGGAKAASLVARNYNLSHLKRPQTMWWHLSGAALTIWLTRNWTPDEVLGAAAAIAKQEAERRGKRNTSVER